MPLLLPTLVKSRHQLRLIAKMEGIPLYSSPQLQRFLYNIDAKVYTPLVKKFETVIFKSKRLIPCVVGGGLFRKLCVLLGYGLALSDMTVGFYDTERKKVYLILSSLTGFMTTLHVSSLLGVQCHEFQHTACHLSSQAAALAWKVEEEWYHIFLTKAVQDGRLKQGAVQTLMPWFKIISNAERKGQSFQTSGKMFKVMAKFAPTSRVATNFTRIGNALSRKQFLANADRWLYYYFYFQMSHAYHTLISEYGIKIRKDPDVSMYYQELFAPSEILAVLASTNYTNSLSVKIMNYGLDALNGLK